MTSGTTSWQEAQSASRTVRALEHSAWVTAIALAAATVEMLASEGVHAVGGFAEVVDDVGGSGRRLVLVATTDPDEAARASGLLVAGSGSVTAGGFRMARTPSTMLDLGTIAPDFRLPDPSGRVVALDDFRDDPALVVAFLCNHCPFVKHIREGLARFGRDYQGKIGMVAINSNDVEHYPADAPPKMAEEAKEAGYVFPYLFDASQSVAKAYRAACTPDFFLFDRTRRLVYRGQFDASRPDSGIHVTGEDLRAAVDAVLAGQEPNAQQRPSLGCNIKWKEGNEPAYA